MVKTGLARPVRPGNQVQRVDARVNYLLAWIWANFQRSTTLKQLAARVHLSPWRLMRLFRAETGFTPMRYLRSARLNHARHLLETTFLSVKEIMSLAGFRSESHFVRTFQAAFGKSPARYRRQRASSSAIITAQGNKPQ